MHVEGREREKRKVVSKNSVISLLLSLSGQEKDKAVDLGALLQVVSSEDRETPLWVA